MNIKELKKNVRDYGMYIALFVIMLLFTILTGGLFMRPRNISNLLDQTGYVAVLAVGMTMILIIRHTFRWALLPVFWEQSLPR